VAAKEGFEPATLWTKGVESTNEPPRLVKVRVEVNTFLSNEYKKARLRSAYSASTLYADMITADEIWFTVGFQTLSVVIY